MSDRWPTAEEELQRRFYDWELVGRGWLSWSETVHLEPPFQPFPGHFLPPIVPVDDGRRETFLSRLAARFLVSPERTRVAQNEVLPTEREESIFPRPTENREPLRVVRLHVPAESVVKMEEAVGFLHLLRGLRQQASFEIVGADRQVSMQFSVRESEYSLLLAALENIFPGVELEAADALAEWVAGCDDVRLGVLEFGLRREMMLPLRTWKYLDPDPLIAFIAGSEKTARGELAAVQVLFEPARAPWSESVFRAVSRPSGQDFFEDNPAIARCGRAKFVQPLFAVTVRVAIGSDHETDLESRLHALMAGLDQFGSHAGNEFFHLDDHVPWDRRIDFLGRVSHRSGMLLGIDELAALVHVPSASVRSKQLVGRSEGHSVAAPNEKGGEIFLGRNLHRGTETRVYVSRERQSRHMHLLGASGSGKSNLLLRLAAEDISAGGGVALLDPHGDLVDELLGRIPEERVGDVILFDPTDAEAPVGFNVLAAQSDLERTILASDLVAVFRRLSTSWGDQMHSILANGIQAFLESTRGGTLLDLRRFLIEREFREEFLTTVPDEEVLYYWKKEFPLLRGRPEAPILTRLDTFLRPRLVRRVVAQKENRIDFRKLMDEGKIFLARLSQGAIGEENAELLGSFLFARFHQTAMSRQDVGQDQRRQFTVIADECHHFVTPSMASIVASTRKYGMGLVLAHQDLTQLERRDREVAAALLANAGTRIVFRVSDSDARTLADGFDHFEAKDLRSLSVGQAICRFDRADRDFNLVVPLAEEVDAGIAAARRNLIVRTSRETYGSPLRQESIPRSKDLEREATVAKTDSTLPILRPVPISHRPIEPIRKPVVEDVPATLLGRGGPQHRYLQELVKRFGESKGYKATIERPTASGGAIDVALEAEDDSIAIEISVTSEISYEVANVRKCLEEGFRKVIVLATERRRLENLARSVKSSLGDFETERVLFQTPEELLTSLSEMRNAASEKIGGYSVKVKYRATDAAEAKARHGALSEILSKSRRKLTK